MEGRPYLGSDDLRDPDSERSNQLVAACCLTRTLGEAFLLLMSNALCQHVKSFNKPFFDTVMYYLNMQLDNPMG